MDLTFLGSDPERQINPMELPESLYINGLTTKPEKELLD